MQTGANPVPFNLREMDPITYLHVKDIIINKCFLTLPLQEVLLISGALKLAIHIINSGKIRMSYEKVNVNSVEFLIVFYIYSCC